MHTSLPAITLRLWSTAAVLPYHQPRWPKTPAACCLAVDRTLQLMWRISHGELPKVKMPKVVMLLIGTDDLGFAYLQSGEAAIADEVQPLVMRCAAPGRCSGAAGFQQLSYSTMQLLVRKRFSLARCPGMRFRRLVASPHATPACLS